MICKIMKTKIRNNKQRTILITLVMISLRNAIVIIIVIIKIITKTLNLIKSKKPEKRQKNLFFISDHGITLNTNNNYYRMNILRTHHSRPLPLTSTFQTSMIINTPTVWIYPSPIHTQQPWTPFSFFFKICLIALLPSRLIAVLPYCLTVQLYFSFCLFDVSAILPLSLFAISASSDSPHGKP